MNKLSLLECEMTVQSVSHCHQNSIQRKKKNKVTSIFLVFIVSKQVGTNLFGSIFI